MGKTKTVKTNRDPGAEGNVAVLDQEPWFHKEPEEMSDGSVPLRGDAHTLPESAGHSAPEPVETAVPVARQHGRRADSPEVKAAKAAIRERIKAEEKTRINEELVKLGLPPVPERSPNGTVVKTFSLRVGKITAKLNEAQFKTLQAWGGFDHIMALVDGKDYVPVTKEDLTSTYEHADEE